MESPQYQGDSETFYRRGGPASFQADLESLYKMDGFGSWDESENIESD